MELDLFKEGESEISFQLFLNSDNPTTREGHTFFSGIILFRFRSSKDEDTVLYGNCYHAGPLFPDPLSEPVIKR